MTTAPKTPPHNVQAEQSVLGGTLLDNRAWDHIADVLREDDFYRKDHRLIFQAIGSLIGDGKPCDVITLSEWLDKSGQLDDAGGHDYLAALAENIPSAANVRSYATIVRECSLLREAACIGYDLAAATMSNDRESLDAIAEAQTRLDTLGQQRTASDLSAAEAVEQGLNLLGEMERRRESGNAGVGIPTGLPSLDHAMTLLGPRLMVVAARPGVGKTAFALQTALHAARRGYRIGAVSLEMGADELAARAMACRHGIDFGLMMEGEENAVTSASNRECGDHAVGRLPLWLDAETTTLQGVQARISRWRREHQIDLAIVDYIGLVEAPGNNQRERLGAVSRTLKRLAKRLNIPIMALAQLNRNSERENRHPQLSDLRDCGDIEQDADVVLMLHAQRRDIIEDEKKDEKGKGAENKPATVNRKPNDDAIAVEFGFLKNRVGCVGWFKGFVFRGRFQRFEELEKRQRSDAA